MQQAIAAWVAEGASATQLESVQVQIGTLDDNLVGLTSGNQITLDATADGWGWNTDTSNADFTSIGASGLEATPGSAAADKMDLLTVVEHELGHELGLSDVDPTDASKRSDGRDLGTGCPPPADHARFGCAVRLVGWSTFMSKSLFQKGASPASPQRQARVSSTVSSNIPLTLAWRCGLAALARCRMMRSRIEREPKGAAPLPSRAYKVGDGQPVLHASRRPHKIVPHLRQFG